jgi:DUF4097 and DUF4098 domain-containing protein YvlB
MKNQKASSNNILTENISVPLNKITAAKIDIYSSSGNLTINPLTEIDKLLVGGSVQFSEKQGPPMQALSVYNGQVTYKMQGSDPGRAWFRMPWAACNGATEWFIQLNPAVSLDINAQSGGGNVRLDLTGMTVTNLSAGTGGGNIDVVLSEKKGNASVTVNSGAGNVTIKIPQHLAARIHATSGLGKLIIDPRFAMVDEKTFQSPHFETAANQVEIKATTGAGNVVVTPADHDGVFE